MAPEKGASEWGRIARLRALFAAGRASASQGVEVDIGDDAAVLAPMLGHEVLSVDAVTTYRPGLVPAVTLTSARPSESVTGEACESTSSGGAEKVMGTPRHSDPTDQVVRMASTTSGRRKWLPTIADC